MGRSPPWRCKHHSNILADGRLRNRSRSGQLAHHSIYHKLRPTLPRAVARPSGGTGRHGAVWGGKGERDGEGGVVRGGA